MDKSTVHDISFEVYTLTNQLPKEQWDVLRKVLQSYLGSLAKFEVLFSCNDAVVRYFLSSDKDLSPLSNQLEGIVLRPVSESETELPVAHGREANVQFVSGGNLLDLKEKYAVKRTRNLQRAHFKIRLLGPEKALVSTDFYFTNPGGEWSKSHKLIASFPSLLLSVNFDNNTHYLKKEVPKYLNIEKSLHMLVSDSTSALFKVDTFPYFSQDYYLNLTSYDFDRHSFIIGASGSGKSKLISLFVDQLYHTALRMNYRIVIIDPHASLASDLTHIDQRKVVTFGNQDGADLFPNAGTDLSSATELTATLFKSVLDDQYNARLDKLLRYSLFVLMTAQTMSLENLKRFLTAAEYRTQVTGHVSGFVPENITKFFGGEFNEIRTQYYEATILPLVTMVDEMQLQPSLVGENGNSLAKMIQENFVTVFSLNKVSMGEKVVKTVAGLLIQQIFLLAQARVFGQKIILIIDEVSVVQNPTIAQILAEARKFNLTVILTQQYFGQVEKGLRDAIFANVFNYYTFKVSEEDARALEGNISIELPKEIIEAGQKKGISQTDLKVKFMSDLQPRQCLVRVMSNGQLAPAVKVTTVDAPMEIGNVLSPQQQRRTSDDQQLPKKFVEHDSSKPRRATLPGHLVGKQIWGESPGTGGAASAGRGSLKDVLSAQSSSRLNAKDKEKS